ncbi:MAG: FtsX-like permease family protein, partial [Longimicrobiales bacterium]
ARRREIALRLALGARRRRLVQQLLVESGILALISGVLAVFVALWSMAFVRIPTTLARGRNFYGAVGEFAEPTMDWRVMGFAVVLCAVTVLLFGMAPALRATRSDLVSDIKGSAPLANTGARRFNLRELVVTLQVAMAVVLVVGCGLLLTSYTRMRETPLGFEPSQLLTFMIQPSEVTYSTTEAPALITRVLEDIESVPGVAAATVDGCAPVSTQCANATLHIVGRPWPTPTDAPSVMRHYVATSHFETLGIPVLRGRALSADDRAGREHVVVINQAAAEAFWSGQDPIGQRVWFDGASAFADEDSSAVIVGVVGDVAYQPLDENPVQPGFFTMYAQFTYARRMVLVRTQNEPLAMVPQIAAAVRRADPDLALFDVQTMEQRARLSWSKHSAQTAVFTIIAGMALILAVTGVYAVAAFFVTSRIRDIGIRIALGASTAHVMRASTARVARLGLLGAGAGLIGAVALSRVLRATLYQTSPLDASVYAVTAGVLLLALAAACYVPIRRALDVDPVEVLRL